MAKKLNFIRTTKHVLLTCHHFVFLYRPHGITFILGGATVFLYGQIRECELASSKEIAEN